MFNDPFHREEPKPFHSSGYAQVSQGNTIGSTNGQTFHQRIHVERNRSSIARYGNSHIGQGYIHQNVTPRVGMGSEAPRQATPPRGHISSSPRGGIHSTTPRTSFREPPARFNPYS